MSAVSELKKLEDYYIRELRKVRLALGAMGVGVAPEIEKAQKERRSRVRGRKTPRPYPLGHLQELAVEVLTKSSNLTANEIAGELRCEPTTLYAALRSLCSRKRIVRSGAGTRDNPYRWALRFGVPELKAVGE